MSLPRPIWIGLAAGFIVSVPCFVISLVGFLGMCSNPNGAETLFPFAMIAFTVHPALGFVLGSVQYPLYGTVLGFAWTKASIRRMVVGLSIVGILIIHVVAIELSQRCDAR